MRYKFIYSVSLDDSGPSFTNGVTFSADSASEAYSLSKRLLIRFCDFVEEMFPDHDHMITYMNLEVVNNDV